MAIQRTTLIFCLLCVLVCTSANLSPRALPDDGDTSGKSRGFTGFINQQDLPWEEFKVKGAASGLKAKTLSRDPQTGAVSLLLSYPPGWRSRANSNYHSGNEEVFVLDGDLSIGERTLTRYCYSFIPAGLTHGPISSKNGCLALTFFDREPDVIASSESKPGAKTEQFVEYKNYFDMPWEMGLLRDKFNLPPPLMRKELRRDPQSGAATWIIGVLGGHPKYIWETHPTWEEGYLLEGEWTNGECLPDGVKYVAQKAGGYFFRPANKPHGGPQSGAKGYAVFLMRAPAKLEAKFSDQVECK